MDKQDNEKKQNIIKIVKIILCALVTALGIYVFVCEGFSDYLYVKAYDVPVTCSGGQLSFEAKGNLLSYIRTSDGETINFDMKTKRGEPYTLSIKDEYPKAYEDEEMTVHFVYSFLDLPSMVLIAFKAVFMLVCLFMLCYSICNIEAGIGLLKQGGAVRWPAAITMSGSVLLSYNPFSDKNTAVTAFDRYIGIGLVNDHDISKVIGNFTKWTASFVALAFLYLIFFRLIGEKDKNENQRHCWEFTHRFFILAMVLMVLQCVNFFKDTGTPEAVFSYSVCLVDLILLSFFAYYILRLSEKISFVRFLWILLGAYTVALPISIAVTDIWAGGRTLFAVQCAVTLVVLILALVLPIGDKVKAEGAGIPLWPAVFISAIPLITSLYIELISILNQHEIFIAAVRKYYIVGMGLLIIIAVACPLFIKPLRLVSRNIKKICYPVVIAGITALSVQPPATAIYEADLYETANYSVLISDFLNHGVVPIVGHYGGHMMTGVWEGIVYGILNKDVFGGSLSPYAGCVIIVTTLCFYYLLKNVWDIDMALFGALLFPFAGYWEYYGLGMLIAIAIIGFAKRNTLGRAVWIWVAFAWVTLYRLDMGTSFGVAAVIALAAYCIIHRSRPAVLKLLAGLGIVAVAAAVLWCGICLLSGVNPALRLLEFIKASASNVTWARETLGDVSKADFSWGYIFVPMAMTLGLGYTLISRRFREDAGEDRYLFLVIFGTAYIANIQRSLVRHTLASGNYSVVLWTSLIFFALFISVKRSGSIFLPAFGAMIIFAGLLGSQDAYSADSVMEKATASLTEHIDSWVVDRVSYEDAADEAGRLTPWELAAVQHTKLERVALDDVTGNRIYLFDEVMDILLDEDETYLDFENHTFLYSATGREDPVYVSQSPMQLSGEFMQRQFIEEVESKNVPIAVLPSTGESSYASVRVDALENASRYYLVSEYIYDNFRPFCSVGEYALWVRPDKYEEKLSRIQGMEEKEQLDDFVAGFSFSHLEMELGDSTLRLKATKSDPFIAGLENGIDLKDYEGGTAKILIDYETNVPGEFQLYYTTDSEESFSEAKMSRAEISGKGTAELYLPVTAHTKLRLDIPDGSEVYIPSIRTASCVELIDYGYDAFYRTAENGSLLSEASAHIYRLKNLPLLWGEMDTADTENDDGTYLCLILTYSGRDNDGADTSDESTEAVLRAGTYDGDRFIEKARYEFNVKEGTHRYLIRLSSDYFWKLGDMTDFLIESTEPVKTGSMEVL